MIKQIIMLLLVIVFIWSPMQVYASARELSYDHALSRVINRSSVLIPLDRQARDANIRARELLEDYFAVVNTDRPEAERIYGERMMALAERDRIQRDRNREIVLLELALRRHLANISQYEAEIEMLLNNLSLRERMLEQTELRYLHGMASQADLREAEHTLEQNALNLDMRRLSLENERQQLNRLIYQPITATIRIVYGDISDLPPIPEDWESERSMNRQTARDHNLLRRRDEAEIARYEWQRQLDDPDVDNSYMRLQHQLAVLERDMAERQAELNVRNVFAYWERLLEEGLAIEVDIAQARADYEDMKNRLEAGLVTQIQVDLLAMALAAEEARLVRHGYDLWMARLRVDHPYVRLLNQ